MLEDALVMKILGDRTEGKEVEDALRRQAQIIDQIHDAVVSTDLEARVTSWNKGAERLFGFSSSEALGKHISFVYPDDQLIFLENDVIKPLKEKGTHDVVALMRRKTGEDFHAHLSLSLLRDARGGVVGMIGYSIDVSDRVRALAEIQRRARQQTVVAELGQRALTGVDLEALLQETVGLVGRTLDVELCKVMELLPDGERLLLRTGIGWKEGYVGTATVAAETGSQAGYTLIHDEPIIVHDLASERRFSGPPLLTDHGVVSGMSVVIQGKSRPFGILGAHTRRRRIFTEDDIHFLQSVANVLADAIERKRAEEELWESEQRFRQLAENIREVFWMASPGGDVLYVSSAYEEIWGRPLRRLYEHPTDWIEAIHPEDRARVAAAYVSEKLARGAFDEEYRVVRPDGSIRWVRDRGFPIRDDSGSVYRIAGIAEEVTERKLAEAERARLLEAERDARRTAEILRAATATLSESLDLEQVLDRILVDLDRVAAADRACVRLQEGRILRVVAVRGLVSAEMKVGRERTLDEDETDREIGTTKSPRILSCREDSDARYQMVVPLFDQGERIGELVLERDAPPGFSRADAALAQAFANQAAMAIVNARLFEAVTVERERHRHLTQRVVTLQEKERELVSRELHDDAGQALTALKISLGLLDSQIGEGQDDLRAGVRDAVDLVEETLSHIRALSRDLRPPVLETVGIDSTLRGYCRDFAQRTKLSIEYSGSRMPPMRAEAPISLFRVLQEALTNAARHAQATTVRVALGSDDGIVRLSIEDDGQGFDPEVVLYSRGRPQGVGLLGMQERVAFLGGSLVIQSRPGEGTRLDVEIPAD